MPIKTEENVQVIFGPGDILVRIGGKKGYTPGVIQFIETEGVEIDDTVMKISDAPVSLIFHKTESLDKVISQLQKLRDIMEKE